MDANERSTLGQSSNPEWHRARVGRVTASKCGDILANIRAPSNLSLMKKSLTQGWLEVDNEEPSAKKPRLALEWGIKKEPVAREQYMQLLGDQWECQERGLCVHPKYSVLACSPDGILVNKVTGEKKLLELKAPYSKRKSFLNKEANDTVDFYLAHGYGPDGKQAFILKDNKRGNGYYAQMALSMAILDLPSADFVVYTLRGLYCVHLKRCKEWEEDNIPKLLAFWHYYLKPAMSGEAIRRLCPTTGMECSIKECADECIEKNKLHYAFQ